VTVANARAIEAKIGFIVSGRVACLLFVV
jgi:hypothetical protein